MQVYNDLITGFSMENGRKCLKNVVKYFRPETKIEEEAEMLVFYTLYIFLLMDFHVAQSAMLMMPKLLEFIIDLFLQKWRKGFCLFEPKYS
jgi:hypothetical protein